MREYDLEVHLRTKQHQHVPASSLDIDSQSVANQALSALTQDPQRSQNTLGNDNSPPEDDEGVAGLGMLYSPAFTDWELQEQALAGAPFWVGADGDGAEGMLRDQWMQDELEMRRLIDAEESVYVDPGMEGI